MNDTMQLIESKIQKMAGFSQRPDRGSFRSKKGQPLAQYFDHTNLSPVARKQDIKRLCAEAMEYSMKAVCVAPDRVGLATTLLKNSTVRIATVISFPHGNSIAIRQNVQSVIDLGADEIDMVAPIGKLKDKQYSEVMDVIAEAAYAAEDHYLKIILETSQLTKEEKIWASLCAIYAGAHMLKTSTGFADGGVTLEDLQLLRSIAGEQIGLKASGGIRTYKFALQCIEQGADRIGSSNSFKILEESNSERVS